MNDEGVIAGGTFAAAAWKPARKWVIIRRVGCWGALLAGVLWPLTMLLGVTWIVTPGFRFVLYGGAFNMAWESPAPTAYPPGFYSYKNTGGAMWLMPAIETQAMRTTAMPTSKTGVILPLWMFVVVLGGLGAAGQSSAGRRGCRGCVESVTMTCGGRRGWRGVRSAVRGWRGSDE